MARSTSTPPNARASAKGSSSRARKPDPAPYIEAVRRVGGDVARSMLIGDTETDRKTGLAVGVPVALVTFGPEGRAIERLAPEALLEHYDDLPALAARMLG